MRFPRLLKISTLEPPKRNRARFPFDSLQGMAKLRLSSGVFSTKFDFTEKVTGNVKHCANLRGFQKGDRNPTSVVAGEGSQGEGESKHPLPVRVFGDFLHGEKVTPRSGQQLVAAKSHIKNSPRSVHSVPPLPQLNITKLCKICYLQLIENCCVWLHNSYK